MKKLVTVLCLSVILSVIVLIPAYAQRVPANTPVKKGPVMQINKYFSTQTTTYSDGKILSRGMIKGPRVPPPGYELKRTLVSLPEPNTEMGINTLAEVPAFNWVFGCSAVSGAMVAGYYDRNGFPDIYTGPTNGGKIPTIEDASWGYWWDIEPYEYPNNPLVASHDELDGREGRGSIDDYWINYGSKLDDPYINRGEQHEWGDAIGDYMKTSQSVYGNTDGSTTFYFYNSNTPLTCHDMEGSVADEDGTYGRKLFYEARGYTVTDCYTQMTDNKHSGGFSFAQYKEEIDAGRPVFLNLDGHSIVGVGYDDATETVYIHDTWDNNTHSMSWGGSYSGMTLWGVSIVNLQEEATSPCGDGYCAGFSYGEDCDTCPEDCISSLDDPDCGNGVCDIDIGEDCLSCPSDCAGKQVGANKRQFCCGDRDGNNPVGCDDERCNTNGYTCSEGDGDPYCCGNGICEGAENSFNCSIDCDVPSSGEICDNGNDDDLDGKTDCDDEDCSDDPYCLPQDCFEKGIECSSDGDCCSGQCHPVKGVCK